ncbi:MAG TPA: biotin/lipoyl-containing protein [Chthonomonadales bacterium]|nr:biotin/lipoyl-containing protein [Chthonomonadales bacterium]
MRIDDIEKLVDLVAQADVSEVIVENGDRRVTVRRFEVARALPAAQTAGPAGAAGAMEGPPSAAEEAGASVACYVITAPMVGVFHRTDPAIGAGSRVRPGQVVGAIESMRLMNDVRAEEGGVVIEAFVEDGMPVEYGHRLFSVEPDPLLQG